MATAKRQRQLTARRRRRRGVSAPRSGNRCGHDPRYPRFERFQRSRYIGVISQASDRLLDYYDDPRGVAPNLECDRNRKSHRRQRSERRWAIVMVGLCILKYVDLVTLRVGIPTPDGFWVPTLKDIAEECGCNVSRVKRALTHYREGGAITSHQHRERTGSGQWRVSRGVRKVSSAFFDILGISRDQLATERKLAADRLRRQALDSGSSLADWTRLNLTLGKLLDQVGKPSVTSRLPRSTGPPRHELLQALQRANPDWTDTKVIAEAKRRLSA